MSKAFALRVLFFSTDNHGAILKQLEDISRVALRISEEQFVDRYRDPVLVGRYILGGAIGRAPVGDPESQLVGESKARLSGPTMRLPRTTRKVARVVRGTMLHMKAVSQDAYAKGHEDLRSRPFTRPLFVWIKHRSRMARRGPVKIGRLQAFCDVVVNDFTVSAEHLWVEQDEFTGVRTLCDRGSSNGTRIGDVDLIAHERVPIKSGESVTVGRFVFDYFEPPDFYAFLCGNASSLPDGD
jgi:hypothetical protein